MAATRPRDLAAAERHYGPALDGADPTRLWVLELNGRSVGMLQDYRVADHPEYALLTAKPDAVGVDYLIGDPSWVGRGIGTRMLWAYLRDVVRPHYPAVAEVFAAPDHRNAASCGCSTSSASPAACGSTSLSPTAGRHRRRLSLDVPLHPGPG